MLTRASKIIITLLLLSIMAYLFLPRLPRSETIPPEEKPVGAETLMNSTEVFLNDGTWTAPTGVTSVTVVAWGGGGGGTTGVGGGGGGAFASGSFTVTPGNVYGITVGSSSANQDADDSTFDIDGGVASLSADGGLSGTNGGTGGSVANSIGTTIFAGGNGGLGTGVRGGGGGAGNLGAGANGGASAGAGGLGWGGGGGGSDFGRQYGGGGNSSDAVQRAGGKGAVFLIYNISATVGYPSVKQRKVSINSSVNTTTFAVAMPDNIVAGDLLVIAFSHGSNTDSTACAGFTELASSSNSTVISHFIYYKVAEGGDTCTITSATTQMSSAVTYLIKDAGIPTATAANGSSTNANAPQHTPAAGSAAYLWLATAGWDASAVAAAHVTGFPSGYSSPLYTGERVTLTTIPTAVSEIRTTASAEDPGTFISTTEQWAAITTSIPYVDQSPAEGGEAPAVIDDFMMIL